MADESYMYVVVCVKFLTEGLGGCDRVCHKNVCSHRTDKMKKAEVMTKIEREVAIPDQSMRRAKLLVSPIVTLVSKFESSRHICHTE